MNVPGATRDSNVVLFAEFAAACPYLEGDTDVNNGYGCTHPENDEREDGNDVAACHIWACPLGREMRPEDGDDRQDYELGGLSGDEEGYMVVDTLAYLEMLKAHPTPALPCQGAEE